MWRLSENETSMRILEATNLAVNAPLAFFQQSFWLEWMRDAVTTRKISAGKTREGSLHEALLDLPKNNEDNQTTACSSGGAL